MSQSTKTENPGTGDAEEVEAAVVLGEKLWGTRYRLKAYPVDGRDEFQFISDLTVRGRAALAEIGAEPARGLITAEE